MEQAHHDMVRSLLVQARHSLPDPLQLSLLTQQLLPLGSQGLTFLKFASSVGAAKVRERRGQGWREACREHVVEWGGPQLQHRCTALA
jgi:hypothetical protein